MVERDTTFHASGLVLRHGMGRRAFCGLHIADTDVISHGTESHTGRYPTQHASLYRCIASSILSFSSAHFRAPPSATPEAKPRGSIVENLELLEKLKSLHDRDGTDGSRFWEAPLR